MIGILVRDAASKRQFVHRAFLGAAYGDSPIQKKLSRWLSHTATLGCGFCCLRGVHPVDGSRRGMYFTGYKETTLAGEPHVSYNAVQVAMCYHMCMHFGAARYRYAMVINAILGDAVLPLCDTSLKALCKT